MIISFSQPLQSCKDNIGDLIEYEYIMNQSGYMKVFDCDKFTNVISTNDCEIKIFIKINSGNVDFLVKSNAIGYKIFLYDIFGRKLVEKDLKIETFFNKDCLANGLYFIKITDGKNIFTKRINL
jgi:hypothetical protein